MSAEAEFGLRFFRSVHGIEETGEEILLGWADVVLQDVEQCLVGFAVGGEWQGELLTIGLPRLAESGGGFLPSIGVCLADRWFFRGFIGPHDALDVPRGKEANFIPDGDVKLLGKDGGNHGTVLEAEFCGGSWVFFQIQHTG